VERLVYPYIAGVAQFDGSGIINKALIHGLGLFMKKVFVFIGIIIFLAACNSFVPVPKANVVYSEALPESEGEQLYLDMKCPTCHGFHGTGDGFMSVGLEPKPTDFSSAEVMAPITDAQLEDAIKNGKGGIMPSFARFTDHQVSELVRYIRSLSQSP
jgi:mono/diheme cytochrome c family protein